MKIFQMLIWAGLLAGMPVFASAQGGSGGWCVKNNYSKIFDPKTVTELKGTVVSVDKITPEAGMSQGIHLTMKTDKNETISVHLGPSWYIDNQEIQLVAGDAIAVKGSKVTYQNAPAIIAMTVEKGDQVLTLRDKDGHPTWNGWRHGKGKGNGKGKGKS